MTHRASTAHHEGVLPPEILEYYLNRTVRHATRAAVSSVDPAELRASLDPINRAIAGAVDVRELYRRSVRCVRAGLSLLFAEGDAALRELPARLVREGALRHRPSPAATAEATRERLARRGVPHASHVSDAGRVVLEVLERSGLVEAQLSGMLHDTARGYHAADLFLVQKSSGKRRSIIDARACNAYVDREAARIELFSLESLLNVMSELSSQGPIYYAAADSRHHFHQIPLLDPEKRRGFQMRTEDGSVFRCVTVPMGWALAPAIGQCVTWAVLLSTPGSNADFRYDPDSGLDEAVVRRILDGERTPAWLPLRGGGGIFVLLDNILVLSSRREVRDYWARRIQENANCFRLRLKHEDDKDDNDATAHARDNRAPLNRRSAIETGCLRPGRAESFVFIGVEWSGRGRRVRLGAEGEVLPGRVERGRWRGSAREMARLLGILLWWRRVSSLDDFAHGGDALALRALYVRHMPPPDAPREAWDQQAATASEEETTLIERLWTERRSGDWHPYATLRVPSGVQWAVCDACGAEDGGAGIGVVYLGQPGRPHQQVHRWEHARSIIATAELEGILRAVQVCASHDTAETCAIVIAGDNLVALRWCERRCGPRDEVNELLRQIYEALAGRRLGLVYVPSRHNAADGPSRHLTAERYDPTEEQVHETRRCLEEGTARLHAGLMTGGVGQAQRFVERIRGREDE